MRSQDNEPKTPEVKPTVDPSKSSLEDRVAALEAFMAHVAHITGEPPVPPPSGE